jgi:hypothetical protein
MVNEDDSETEFYSKVKDSLTIFELDYFKETQKKKNLDTEAD